MDPICKAIELYESLIDSLSQNPDHNLCALGDPHLEGFRFYTFEKIDGSFDYDLAQELEPKKVDQIEEYLIQAEAEYSLLEPLLQKLKSLAPAYNAEGNTVFIGSWGMGHEEIGWLIRHLNDRPTFDRYLNASGIIEVDVDEYNEAYSRELKQADPVDGGQ